MKAIVALIAVLFFLFNSQFVSSSFASNLLLNPSFEDPASGSPISWTKSVSTAILSTSTTAKTGTSSASINKTNSSTGLIYLYQDIDVESDAFYSLSGYAVKNNANFSWVILRISWRSSSAEISKTDSSQLTSDASDFQLLEIDSAQAPSQAIKARVELAANIATINPSNPALFDDIDFSQIPVPDQPTPTPAPTSTPIPTATSIPTPTKTPTPSPAPTATKTPTPTPTKIPIPTLKLSASPMSEEALSTEILGESTESGEIESTIDAETLNDNALISSDSKNTNNSWLQKISIGIGGILLIVCAILFFRFYIKNKEQQEV